MANLTPQLTNTGTDMMTLALNGDGIVFTKICLGDGISSDQQGMTALNHLVMEVPITDIARQANYVLLTGRYSNSDLSAGFYAKELGVYAKNVGDATATQKLYAYRYAASEVDFIPAVSSGRVVDTEITVIVSVGTAESISAIIAEGTGYASEVALNDHINDLNNPHQVTAEMLGLGNVVNKSPDDMVVTPAAVSTLEEISQGDTMAQVVGKIKAAISFLKTHILNKNNPHGVTITQIGAAASSHTHAMSSITGTLPVSKGGTGVNTVAALKSLIQQYAGSQDSGFNPFLLTLGDAVVEVNGDDVSISLADMGITETQFEEITQEITWAIGYAINVKTGALETTSSRTIYYAQIPVVPGEEVRLRGWFSYSSAAYCVYDANDVPLTWDVGHEIPYVTREMYITLDFTVPPGSSYMVICNYNARVDRGLDEYALSIRNGNN